MLIEGLFFLMIEKCIVLVKLVKSLWLYMIIYDCKMEMIVNNLIDEFSRIKIVLVFNN